MPAESRQLTFIEKAGYSAGDAAANLVFMSMILFQTSFYTEVFGLSARLAGAMGKPTTLLLPHDPDFRWLLARADTPWYPGMRLIRQTAAGDWRDAIAQVAASLGVP